MWLYYPMVGRRGERERAYVSQWGGYVSDDDAVDDLFESRVTVCIGRGWNERDSVSVCGECT